MNNIKKVQKVVITRRNNGEGEELTYRNVYVKIKPDAIDISDWKVFRFLMYFNFTEIEKFEIDE